MPRTLEHLILLHSFKTQLSKYLFKSIFRREFEFYEKKGIKDRELLAVLQLVFWTYLFSVYTDHKPNLKKKKKKRQNQQTKHQQLISFLEDNLVITQSFQHASW